MTTSAENQFYGKISQVNIGAINTEVTLQVAADFELVAIITNLSAIRLGLHINQNACALIKASDAMLFIESAAEPYSARNLLWGNIVAIEQGAVNNEIIVDLGNKQRLSAIITCTSTAKLALAIGMRVGALIKAPQVMLAIVPEKSV